MRKIKFRAWDRRDKIMIYPENMHLHIFPDDFYHVADCFDDRVQTEPEFTILMQYTGLKDKNGKEIYEGDIVKVSINSEYEGRTTDFNWHFIDDNPFDVIFEDGLYKLHQNDRGLDYPILMDTWALIIEIIGNIYENPELLTNKGE